MLINVLCFLLGIAVTVLGAIGWAWYLGTQERVRVAETARQDMEDAIKQFEEQQKAAQDSLQQSLTELIKRRQATTQAATTTTDSAASPSVKERLRKAVEITAKQAKIDIRQGPEFIMEHNELELEKLCVLKTILADGFDPLITIRYSTGDQEMLLSTYIQSLTKGLA